MIHCKNTKKKILFCDLVNFWPSVYVRVLITGPRPIIRSWSVWNWPVRMWASMHTQFNLHEQWAGVPAHRCKAQLAQVEQCVLVHAHRPAICTSWTASACVCTGLLLAQVKLHMHMCPSLLLSQPNSSPPPLWAAKVGGHWYMCIHPHTWVLIKNEYCQWVLQMCWCPWHCHYKCFK